MGARLAVFVLWLIHFLPFRVIVAIGNGLGELAYRLARGRRRVGEINLRLCFPHMPEAERERLLHAHFRMFMRGLIERSVLWWSSAARYAVWSRRPAGWPAARRSTRWGRGRPGCGG
jgi:KDO2-lipid IV(A) lauroyltransferase